MQNPTFGKQGLMASRLHDSWNHAADSLAVELMIVGIAS